MNYYSKSELIIITGLSGAGKSTAIGFLEDMGYYCIDNMPPVLLNTFIEILSKHDDYKKLAVGIDIRTTDKLNDMIDSLNSLENYDYDVKVIYLDIKNDVALKRYKLTRRRHPYADKFRGNIQKALDFERKSLTPIREKADFIIDTSSLSGNQLRTRLSEVLTGDSRDVMNIYVESFGFKHGIPTDADFVIDVRCLPNPYWVESLRNKTGLDREVSDYVFSFKESRELLSRLIDLLDFLNPLYIKEGKSQIVFAIGCTGGNHRSVAFAEKLKEHFSKKWDNVSVNHRDISKK